MVGVMLEEPLSEPLDISFRPQAEAAMKYAGVRLLSVDVCWDCLRHYRPEHWQDVLNSLRIGATKKWL